MHIAWQEILTRAFAIVLVSTLLGIAFNAAHPLGIAWQRPILAKAVTPNEPHAVAENPHQNPLPAQHKSPVVQQPVERKQPKSPVKMPVKESKSPRPSHPHYTNQTVGVSPVTGKPTTHNPYQNDSLATTIIAPPPDPPAASEAITWDKAEELVATKGAVLVDARPSGAFQAGSIPGAVSLPSGELEKQIKKFSETYGADTYLIIYCSDLECGASAAVAQSLIQQYGYKHVYHMPGGYREWQRAKASASIVGEKASENNPHP